MKSAVRIEDYLRDQGVGLSNGRTRCPVHGGDNPHSFNVDAAKQVWHCFSCGEGGDLITLCQRLEGGEPWEAMISLSERYGIRIPDRNEAWHRRQQEKRKDYDSLLEVIARSYQRRLFRVFIAPYLEEVDEEVRETEAERIWNDLRTPARSMAYRRISK